MATLALGAALLLGGCEELGPEIDPFPIPVNRLRGPLRAGLRAADGEPAAALIDTNTPLTVLDRDVEAPSRLRTDVTLLSACDGDDPLAGCTNVARALWEGAAVVQIHPCGAAGAECRLGIEPLDGDACGATPGPETVTYGAILGGDLLSQAAVRIDLRDDAAPALHMFPDIAGDRAYHCRDGVAVIDTPLAGGAVLEIEGGEVSYAASRLPISACADYDAIEDAEPSGTDLLLVLATGIGPSVISESAYARYYQRLNAFCVSHPERCGGDPDQVTFPRLETELERVCLQLPAGPAVARVATLRRLAIAGRTDRARGPCEERRAARIMSLEGECADPASCPCETDETRCETPAAVDLEPATGISVAVLPDSHPLLQGLREELRPGVAEVDGLLGLDALHALRLDLDYPGARMLVRCAEPDGARPVCTAYTEVGRKDGVTPVGRCPRAP